MPAEPDHRDQPGPADPVPRHPLPAAVAVQAEVAALGYEQARDQLVEVVRRLESGAATLEESLELWERGEALATRCEQWLLGARERLERAGDAQEPAADRP